MNDVAGLGGSVLYGSLRAFVSVQTFDDGMLLCKERWSVSWAKGP